LQRRKRRSADLTRLVAAADEVQLGSRYREALHELFAPLKIEQEAIALPKAQLDSLGVQLFVPGATEGRHFVCHLRNDGKNLYRREDLVRAEELTAMGRAAHRAILAREEGERTERDRIRRDLHDDVGASLVRIIHSAEDSRVANMAKAAMRELRNVLLALSHTSARPEEVLAELKTELGEAVASSGGELEWDVVGEAGWELSGMQRSNVVRTLREATTNAVKHGAGTISFRFILSEDGLRAVLANRRASPSDSMAGSGLSNIRARMSELGGTLEVDEHPDRFSLKLDLPRTVSA
jgi:signal transduction histidine kinase